jgi:hypothetical protein
MNSFDEIDFKDFFPAHLHGASKDSLKVALRQFHFKNKAEEINYSNFYSTNFNNYFSQGDVISEIRYPISNLKNYSFEKGYVTGIILSNTCDISKENKRSINLKQTLFAPVIKLQKYLDNLDLKCTKEQIKNHHKEIISQRISNLFFLPDQKNINEGFIALLDRIFWFPTSELDQLAPDEDRLLSLNQFGFYLFLLKISFHLCRLPETTENN